MANTSVLNTFVNPQQGVSRYVTCEVIQDSRLLNGQARYTQWNLLNIDLSDAIQYTVRAQDLGRLDVLSAKVTGLPDYWWAIAKVNNIKNQFTDMSVGQIIILPSLTSIVTALQENIAE